ncbi:MAG TPA: Hsp70 family protein [Kofleriaceae bacterium]|nr:Hsp70 family protein [Kofleriaceae bacterium]
MPASDEPIVGIDMGTTYTSIGVVQGQKVALIARAEGSKFTPSVVSFPAKDQIVVGEPARARIATDPARTVVSPKRLLGRPFGDREVQTFLGQAAYRSRQAPDGATIIEIWQTPYAIPQLCAYLLADAKENAQRALGKPVKKAVCAVPVSFTDAQIAAMRKAAQMAGLDMVATVDEPSAAALANRYVPGFGGTIGIFDFGGGTFDFSLVDVSQRHFRILATAGDTWLGGDDLDLVLADAAANQFWRQHKVDLRKQAVEWQKLRFACEQAKRELSAHEQAVIRVPQVLRTAAGMVDLELAVDRPTLARASAALIKRALDVCDKALAKVGIASKDLTAIYLCGGTTHIPAVRDAVAKHFNVPLRTGVAPDQAVCLGAAIQASHIASRRSGSIPKL